ncbi:ArsC family reductase [Bowmanella dokdonensis]|uniref:ArsC family reductase n=1 Tax=Bowmanella dokdonensis TaxID=751969 RepID=A0A939DLB5_9ALTE|nr:ArsC family reductase [Bowmanella dokdonensis]MBN7824588.1 ArsC family reductase [Bowmanella dokdonensis]
MTTLYGIKNCDTIKKARHWLETRQIPYEFHDYRQQGLDKRWLQEVAQRIDWQLLLNTRGTTFRQLADEQKAALDQDKAILLMCQYPAMIKRPLLEHQGQYHLGFKADHYESLFDAK